MTKVVIESTREGKQKVGAAGIHPEVGIKGYCCIYKLNKPNLILSVVLTSFQFQETTTKLSSTGTLAIL